MIQNDLPEAHASVDWPMSRFMDLNDRLERWLNENVTIEIEDLASPAEADPIIAMQKADLPLAFNVEVGAYISSIRSSLDILAMALIQRHNVTIDPRQVQFPIANDESSFLRGKYQGREFGEALPESERSIINAIRPYGGGNEAIITLHRLDVLRKHRRLLEVEIRPLRLSLAGADLSAAHFFPIKNETGWLPVNEGIVLGLIQKCVPRPEFRFFPYIAFNEVGMFHRKPVLASLIHLAEMARATINLFAHQVLEQSDGWKRTGR